MEKDMTKRRILASLAIALSILVISAPAKADDPLFGGGGGPIYLIPPGSVPGDSGGGDPACFRQLVDCMDRASQQPSFWDRVIAGLDCEANFLGCLRKIWKG
jgi:hypothetical protein